ncbi:MAG: hypothetical protein HWE27_14260 [Gammaproteobacteria bacterium]|nr:hypothetical protein [Gammaproteobacteria bacterium]
MKNIIDAIKANRLKDVYFGTTGFRVADESSIDRFQLGYSKDKDGKYISGSSEGDWQKTWVVIATDTEVGDPIFVDTSKSSLPVYTAMHGVGEWDAELVATSLSSFLEILSYLYQLTKQEFALIEPNERTITNPKELAAIESKLIEISGEKDYWQNFIEEYQEWLEEFED